MSDEKESRGSDLVIKAGLTAEGGGAFELGVNKESASWLGKLAPRWAARSRITLATTEHIIGRLQRGEPLTGADANFLAAIGATAEAQWVRQARQLQIAQKAQELYPLLPPAAAPAPAPGPELPPLKTPARTGSKSSGRTPAWYPIR